MSGRLSTRKHIESFSDGLRFLKHKFLAIYPLYLISLATLVFIPFKDLAANLKLFIMSAVCINVFIPPMVHTLWFLTVLLLFYLITPIFLSRLKMYQKILIALFIYAVLLAENIAFGLFDPRLVRYFPVYIFGLLLSQKTESRMIKARYFLIAAPISAALLYVLGAYKNFISSVPGLFNAATFVFSLSFILCMLVLCEWLSKLKKLYRFFFLIAYASNFSYLFHRQYYGAWKRIFNIFPVWLAYLVIFPSLIVLSYFGQKLYSMLLKKIEKKR